MEKRGRGRPRKIKPPNNTLGKTTLVKRDGKVSYSDDLPEFYKFYVSDLWSERLRIPQDFVEKFGGNIPAIVTLRGASGISQQANMNKINNDWFLEKGWPEFVKENSIEEGDFITFSYAANATFYVKVFAVNGCRKEVDDLQDNEVSKPVIPEKNRGKSIFRNRSFSVVMKKSYVHQGWLHLPMEFWRDYVEKNKGGSRKRMVSLCVKRKSWDVCLFQGSTRIIFSEGWGKFAVDNSLQSGSLCTFKLIDRSNDNLAFEVIC